MKHLTLPLLGAGLLASLIAAAPAPIEDEKAPAIEAQRWINVLGEDPTLTSLKGRPILVEVWATW